MNEIWETIKNFFINFFQNGALTIVRCIAFFILGLIILKIVRSIVVRTTMKSRLDKSAATFIISIVTVVLYIALVIVVVSALGFSTAGIIAAFSAIALAVALALQDSLASLANGIIIIFTKPFKKGDYVEINGKDGLVQDIRLFNTKIVTYNNEEILLPNNQILGSTLINYSTMSLRRVVIEVPIPYSAELSEVKEILLSTLNSHQDVVKTPAPAVVLDGYGDSALKFKARAWTPNEKYWDTRASLFEMIFNNLREKGIEIPFNQLDVHLQRDEEKEANAQ
ncbi:mechanosensitive ion channel family protein [Candidatus Borkfalkia ceftriaxoniphila]|uniref:Mechanosensitive ion channel family protein n=1 Tax=Candidatus Borkfalkia ceftriaxoniphila TaxID=2508949 RepID=A0A4Q2K962_9FIRM|nr:mechanosensitive ion channel family protein [Candidatus Borkfalkia ceftriaxoniphila]RXZ58126.1 mechanosensitive ion channel family protein [Candidatus Borkfalkia ceftriaxoniphila]